MAPRKRRRNNTSLPEIMTPPMLPDDLLLEIMVRTDFFTLIRCTAVCKHLRHDILSPPFVHQVTLKAPPYILVYLSTYDDWCVTLVHPLTPAAISLWHDHLSPFISRRAANLVGQYYHETSRGGLVVLRREVEDSYDLCVYDPMTGDLTFLSKPPDVQISISNVHEYVLLTAADGIDCSFMLLSIVFNRSSIKVHTATSSSSTWGPITCASHFTCWSISHQNDPAVLRGCVIHWLRCTGDQIVTYEVRTRTPRIVNLPVTGRRAAQLHLATSPDGNLLKLLAIDGFMISVWLQVPTVSTDSGGWALETMIDIEEGLRSLCPCIPIATGPNVLVEFQRSGERNGDVVLLEVQDMRGRIVLDLETKEMHTHNGRSLLMEIDIASHLQTMKVFS